MQLCIWNMDRVTEADASREKVNTTCSCGFPYYVFLPVWKSSVSHILPLKVQMNLSVLNALHNHLNLNPNIFQWQRCLDMCETCQTECPGLTPREWISLQWTLVRPHYRTGKEERLCDLMTLPHGGRGGGGWDHHKTFQQHTQQSLSGQLDRWSI